MIITKEKYKDSYIVYIDEITGNIDNLPAHWFDCLCTSLEDHSQVYADESTDILLANISDYSLRRQRLGERRMNLL